MLEPLRVRVRCELLAITLRLIYSWFIRLRRIFGKQNHENTKLRKHELEEMTVMYLNAPTW